MISHTYAAPVVAYLEIQGLASTARTHGWLTVKVDIRIICGYFVPAFQFSCNVEIYIRCHTQKKSL